jgi:hypothetical protein
MLALAVGRQWNHGHCLTCRRVPEARNEASRIFYGDVPIGTIGIRAGVPIDVAMIPNSCSNCERWRRDKDGVPLLDRQSTGTSV